MRAVFEDSEIMMVRYCHQGVKISRVTAEVNRNDGASALGNALFNASRIEIIRARINIGKDRNSADA